MKVLVTGATGFLGSYLVKALLNESNQVVILKRSFSDTWRISSVLSQLQVYNTDECELEQVFKDHGKFDAVIHTATCYGRKGENSIELVQSNVLFPLTLLELAIRYGTTLFLNTDTFFNTENIKSKYLSGYSFSKKQFNDWGKIIANKCGIKFVNIKLEHVYGPLDDEAKFVPFIIRKCIANTPEVALTSGKQKRDFIYIDDVISAYLLLLHYYQKSCKRFYNEYEVGTGIMSNISDFVEFVCHSTNATTKLNFGALVLQEGEIMQSYADNTKLLSMGWFPKFTVKEGVKKCIDSMENGYEKA